MIVFDTNVVSYLFKGDTRAALYRHILDEDDIAISFMSVAELLRWAEEANWGASRRSRPSVFLQQFVRIESNARMCQIWAHVRVSGIRGGRPIATEDAWIAATALHLGVPLVTHNRRDFSTVPGRHLLPEAT